MGSLDDDYKNFIKKTILDLDTLFEETKNQLEEAKKNPFAIEGIPEMADMDKRFKQSLIKTVMVTIDRIEKQFLK